ncbi:unnamed protein product [Euphydryas editha]|uniref:Uncharacterized protein n=1 Tax=Euphydryas editha TaxID=104508 RepID=A0AAU9TP56_EUPED|nr:unnamed protein product [Euphydryas editha]
MSEYLWGIAQLVNDPSNDLLNVIRRRISGKQSKHTLIANVRKQECKCNDTNKSEIKFRESFKNARSSVCIPETSDTINETKSKCIQIGTPLSKYREVAVQSEQVHTQASKTTSIQQITLFSRCTEATESKVKKDACSEPDRKKLCRDHYDVIKDLRNLASFKEETDKKNLIMRMILKIKNFIHFFKIKKIQNYPEYNGPEEEIMKLYREASFNKFH